MLLSTCSCIQKKKKSRNSEGRKVKNVTFYLANGRSKFLKKECIILNWILKQKEKKKTIRDIIKTIGKFEYRPYIRNLG